MGVMDKVRAHVPMRPLVLTAEQHEALIFNLRARGTQALAEATECAAKGMYRRAGDHALTHAMFCDLAADLLFAAPDRADALGVIVTDEGT